MDYRDIDVFVWKMKVKDKKFADRFAAIVYARMVCPEFGIVKDKNGNFKWQKK
jgi:hypothetical protein